MSQSLPAVTGREVLKALVGAKTIGATPGEPMTFTDAVDLVGRFLNPILAGPITGT